MTEPVLGVVLTWDSSPDTNVTGYAVQYGTNTGAYQIRVDVGNQTNATILVPTNGAAYYFVATAYTVDGVESLPSNEVNYAPPATSTNQAIAFGALAAKTFGDPAFTLSATASSGLTVSYASGNPSVAMISGNTVTLVGAGSAVITASQAGGGSFSAAASVTQTLTVNKAMATVTLSGLSATYDGTAKSATATTSPSGLSTTITYNGNSLLPVNAGSYAVVATINHANYTGSGSGTLSIAQQNQAITFGALAAKTFGGPAFTLSATASSGLPVSYASGNPSVATISGNTVTLVGAGSAVITAGQAGDGNFSAAANATQTLTVNKATATVTLSGLSATYDGTAKSATATTSPSGLPTTTTYNGSSSLPVNAGSYAVVATINHPNYSGSASGTLVIAQPSQTITFATLGAKIFGDPAFTLSATASSGLPVSYASANPNVATISGNTVTLMGAGSAVITASQAGDGSFSAAPNVTQTLTVSKATATLTLSGLSATYDGSAKSATATTSPSGLPTTITYNGSSSAPVNAGSYAVLATINHANYSGSASGTLTIAQQSQAITFGTLGAKTFGDPAFTLSATASSGLPVSYASGNPGVATISGNTVTLVGAGSAVITASQAGDGSFSAAANVTQTLTVSKATATLTLSGLSATYDGSAKSATATTSPSGLPTTITYNGSSSVPVNAGSYAVVATINHANYSGSASGTLVITQPSQTITFGTLGAKTFGDPAFTLSATASSGLPVSYASGNPGVATISGNTVTLVGAGSALITASQAGDGNFSAAASVMQTLTVNKATATVTLSGLTATYDGTAKSATATTSPSGLPTTTTYNGSSSLPVNAGSYAVVATINHANYSGSGSGTLAIAQPSQTITFGALGAKTFGNPAFTLSATASSGLPVSYASGNPGVATISGNTVTLVGAGSAVITASQAGNNNFKTAANVTQTLTVNKATATVTLSGLVATYDGTPKSATATTSPSGLPTTITYSGRKQLPVKVGSYAVVATISAANYSGSASGTLTITKQAQPGAAALTILQTSDGLNQQLRFSVSPGQHWQLQASEDSLHWATLCELDAVTNGSIDVFDPIIPSQPGRLYRLVNAPISATNQVVEAIPGAVLLSKTVNPLNMRLRVFRRGEPALAASGKRRSPSLDPALRTHRPGGRLD